MRSFLLAGGLFGMSFASEAQNAPVFDHAQGGVINIPFQVCQDATSPADITSYLSITDLDGGDNETWTNLGSPVNGTVSGFPHSELSTGGSVIPSTTSTPPAIGYQPNPGFHGIDTFTVQVDDGTGNVITALVSIVVQELPSANFDPIPSVCFGATNAMLSFSNLQHVGAQHTIFPYIGGPQIWIVPPFVTSVDFDVQGGAGGSDSHSPLGTANPGAGGRVTGTLNVNTVTSLNINVGGRGGDGSTSGAIGGWNGGGNASFYFFGSGGAGGGASDIRMNGNAFGNRVVVAGGGGGNGWDAPGPSMGGAGGNLIGGSGGNNVGGGHAGGGTQLTGGAGAFYSGWASGGNGSLGTGGDGSTQGISGGGGGGYYGGGGGVWSGGGGGSSYAEPLVATGVTMTQGYQINDGIVNLDYMVPGTYTITWDVPAQTAGFTPVTAAALPSSSPITIAVPSTAVPDTYTGTLWLSNGTCTSIPYPISITVNPIPDVAPPTVNDTVCDNTTTAGMSFTGSVPGTTFDWTNDNTSIGLPATGSGDVAPFFATNTTPNPQVAHIVVTPMANGCTGSPVTFTIVVNPTPVLSSVLNAPDMCDSDLLNYNPTSLTPGTIFVWSLPTITGISYPFSSGNGNPSSTFPPEFLYNSTNSPITVPIRYDLMASGCANTEYVNVTVNPKPTLTSLLNPAPVCDGDLLSYIPTSGTSPVVFTWNRNIVAGISNTAATGTNNPNETLHNITANPVVVPYIYRLDYGTSGCFNTQTVMVTVNPTPRLNSGLTPAAVCDNAPFSYGATSATTGTSFSWDRATTTGISNLPNSANSDSVNETLNNTTPGPVAVTYAFTLIANGCTHVDNVVVNVKPTPRLSTTLSPSVCDSTVFNYPPASLTTGTTFDWSRAAVANITNPANSGSGNPNEALMNTSPAPVVATYVYTLTANGCTNAQNVNLTVNPRPMLSSSLTPPTICDSTVFSYNPSSLTAGTGYAWYRPYIPGIYAVASSGTGNPNQQLINSTYVKVDVAYTYTLTANGCSNTQNVVVVVNPTPKLNPPLSGIVCSGYPFHYTPTSYTPAAGFSWNRPVAGHVNPPTAFGTSGISETLMNDQMTPVTTTYYYRLSIGSCINLYPQAVTVTINPTPQQSQITVHPTGDLCSGTEFINFGIATTVPGVTYHWTVTNGQIVATGTDNQNALVSFSTPGPATVSVTSNVNDFGCSITGSYSLNVNGGTSQHPRIVYSNGQFICLQNDNDSYQWGYDDARTLVATELTGEIDQNYNNGNPDFNNKFYWCITRKGDCMQKAYYNVPTGITTVNAGDASLKVYPNPASEIINVEVNTSISGNMTVDLINIMGQKLGSEKVINNKANFMVGSLPGGAYLIECYRDGVKVASSKFIKN